MKKYEYIDYARGFSIFTIVIYDFLFTYPLPTYLNYAKSFGAAGIHLFFFVSGFGLTLSKYTDYQTFIKRRLIKVLVPYYITITLIFLINLVTKVYGIDFLAFLGHILLFKMFNSDYTTSYGAQFWFISTIVQFYLIFPLLLWILKSEKYKLFILLTVVISVGYSLFLSFVIPEGGDAYKRFFFQYLWEFALGMVVARTGKLDKLISAPIIYFFIIAIISMAATAILAIKGGDIGKNLNDIFAFFAYTSLTIILFRIMPLINKFFLWISKFSFSLYLTHMILWDYIEAKFNSSFFTPLTLSALLIITLIYSYYYDILLNKITARITSASIQK
ncbi:acyltransferase [Emticicia sp. BO119]|uniref:acyltransferase family protein n=1 Tax=Emticicia sp. BO119 TaxID=2757768 RepID=UPI0015F050A2|nr:acyltransferase [Emticicia sp. BO119]MBA4853083.1 acyltransferase [Emticicia sp. BO119]